MLEELRAWSAFAEADLAPASVRSYRYWVVTFVAWGADPHSATAQDVTRFLAQYASQGPAKQGATQALRHLFRFLYATEVIAHDPTIILPRTRRASRRAPDWFTPGELDLLFQAAEEWDPEWAASLRFIYATGARIGEACGVAVPDDIDLSRRIVTFRHTKNGHDRVVHLGPMALKAARQLYDGYPTLLKVGPHAITARMKRAARMAGLDERRAHPHALRHSAGTHLRQRGAKREEIKAFLGHTTNDMTDWYVHIVDDGGKRVAGLL